MFTFDGLKDLGKAVSKKLGKWIDIAKDKIFDTQPKSVAVGILNHPEVATYASYLEYGWAKRVTAKQAAYFRAILGDHAPKRGSLLLCPPRPIFGASSRAYRNAWAKLLADELSAQSGRKDNERALAKVGMTMKRNIQETIAANGTREEKFSNRSALTLELLAASASGHKTDATGGSSRAQALVRTGRLLNSIDFKVEKKGAPDTTTVIHQGIGK